MPNNEIKGLLPLLSDTQAPYHAFRIEKLQDKVLPVDDSKKAKYGSWLNTTDILSTHNDLIFASVIQNYDLPDILTVASPDVISVTSRKIVIKTQDGDYFLKKKADYCCTPASLKLSANFQDFLAEKSSFVPEIIKTKDNEPYTYVGSHVFLLTRFVEGRLFRGDTQDIKAAGMTLGKMHALSAQFESDSYPIKYSQDDTMEFLKLAQELPNSEKDPWKNEALAKLNEIFNKFLVPRDVIKKLPHIVNHGDFAPFNLVFGNNGVAAVNDFDNNGLFPRIRDLADAIMTFCDGISYAGATSIMRRPIAKSFNMEKASQFFESYRQFAPAFSHDEKEQLTREALNRWVELMSLGLVRGDFGFYDILQSLEFESFAVENLPKLF